MTFLDYVQGRSVAVVGPAPMPIDQSAEIDAHDLVYRPCRAPIGGHYGSRIDIAYINAMWSRDIYDDEHTAVRESIEPATWWVFKTYQVHRRDGFYRTAVKPGRQMNINAVTGILFDLIQNDVGSITVYGADLYASGPQQSYNDDYGARWTLLQQASGVVNHDPLKQMAVHRAIYQTGKIVGDRRYIAAVTMPDDDYEKVIAEWRRVIRNAETSEPALI
jgi:hypothetical protein